MRRCSHRDHIRIIALPEQVDGCEECLPAGQKWLRLRICLECGHVGCCDQSPHRHATAHANATGHPIIRSLEPGEEWAWCYIDRIGMLVREVAGSARIPPSPLGPQGEYRVQADQESERMAYANFQKALNDADEIELTTTGRNSGRESSRPVWFIQQGENVYLLPVTGSDSQWYKNVLKTPSIRLAAGDTEYSVRAVPVTDPTKVDEVVESFRSKYGAADFAAYYPKHDVAVKVPPA